MLLFAARFVNLGADPPLYYTGFGQSLLTDPYHLTFAARNATLFEEWNPFDYHRWDVFKNSLISGVAFLLFQLFGVSRITANIAALILSCGGFLFFLAVFLVRRRLVELAASSAFLLLNNLLFFYGRVPFLETGLIFLSGLLFYVFIAFHDRWWGQLLSGVLVAFAALAGKLFGLLLIAPVVLCLAYRYRSKLVGPVAWTIGGLIAGAGLYILAIYGGDFSTAVSYYQEHTTGMYPYPPGLTSVVAFFKMFITYGGESGLWDLSPFQLLLGTAALVVVVIHVGLLDKFSPDHLPVIFCLVWVVAGIAGLSPFFYRPTRYSLFLLLPLAGLVGFVVQEVWSGKLSLKIRGAVFSMPFVFLSCWYTLTQLRMINTKVGGKFNAGIEFMTIAALIAAAFTAVVFLLLSKKRTIAVSRRWLYLAALVGVLMIGRQAVLLWEGIMLPGQHFNEYNRELSQILDKDAVLTGPFMPALTIDNELKGIIYVFGLADVQPDLFDRYPITHVVENKNNWPNAVKEFPKLARSQLITYFPITNQVMGLYRLFDASSPMTDFERGSLFLRFEMVDSALVSLGRFHHDAPDNVLGTTNLAMALYGSGRLEDADSLLQLASELRPDSYMVHGLCEATYRRMFEASGQPLYLERAEYHARVTRQVNPSGAEAF